MLKIWTSYFYQVRNFPSNVIPLSTAVSDPKWYHDNRDSNYVFRDKRDVYNGLRILPLVPNNRISRLCHGSKNCQDVPWNCAFLKGYREQIYDISYVKFMSTLEDYIQKVVDLSWFDGTPEVALLFHEVPDNVCSERMIITEWFADNGYSIEEWGKGPLIDKVTRLRENRDDSEVGGVGLFDYRPIDVNELPFR